MQNTMSRNPYENMQPAFSGQTMTQGQMYPPMSSSNMYQEHTNNGLGHLSEGFANLNLRNTAMMTQGKAANTPMPMNDSTMPAMLGSQPGGPILYQLADGTFVYSSSNAAQGNYSQYPNGYNYAITQPTQYQQAAYHSLSHPVMPNGPHTPRNAGWMPPQPIPQVPDLVAHRRSSWSSNEGASPQTPIDGYQAAVLISGQSPTTWSTTPSPMQSQFPYNQQIAKDRDGVPVYADFWAWTQKEPAIPPPVPAIHSGPDGGRGSLDKILDNRNGTTNVYIRGLQPDTNDEMLEGYGKRFGAIASLKAIIEMSNGTCKGYGFIMYHNYIEAENCIRAFFFLGYEAKFAKESHNQRLKALADENNTNLYVSNLPKLMNESGLEALFQDVYPSKDYPNHKPTSSKILKDGNGISRGVGFARFQTPQICQQIIDTFNNKTIGEGKMATILQIRYADTEEQKKLKTFTAEKRTFKTNEYNEVVYGPSSPWRRFYSPNSTSSSYQSPFQTRAAATGIPWSTHSQGSSISPPYTAYPQSLTGYGQSVNAMPPAVTAKSELDVTLPARHPTRIKIESPSVAAAAKKAAAEKVDNLLPDGDSSSISDEDTLVCKSKSSKSAVGDVPLSPTKSKL